MTGSLCLLACLFFALSIAVEPNREWTILHYNEADDRVLETSLIDNVQEMVRSMTNTSDYTFNLIVRYDGWTGQKPLGTVGRVTEVVDLLVTYRSGLKVLDRLGELDMQNSDNMINFFVKYITNYPANNYMIIFSDHADALLGYGGDDTIPGGGHADTITARALAKRLETVLNRTKVPGNKFSIVGFDACLMGNLESLDAFTGVANYMMASQWVEPARGWDYAALATITNSTKPAELGESFIRSYTAANAVAQSSPSTLSIYDLSKVNATIDALFNFVTSSAGISPAFLEDVARARNQIPCDRAGPCDFGTFVDELLDMVSDDPEFNEVVYNGYQLQAAIDDLIWFFMSGPEDDKTTGLAIWFPTYISDIEYRHPRLKDYKTTFPHFVFWWDWLTIFINADVVPIDREPFVGNDIKVEYDSLRNEVRFATSVTNPNSVMEAFLWIYYQGQAILRLPATIISTALEGEAQEEAGEEDSRGIGQYFNYTRSVSTNSSGTRGVVFNSSGTRGVSGTNGTRWVGNFSRGVGSTVNRTAVGPQQGVLEVFWDYSYYTWPGTDMIYWPCAQVQAEKDGDEYRQVLFSLEGHKGTEVNDCGALTNWDVSDGAWVLDSSHLYCEDSEQGGVAEISIQNATLRYQIIGDLYAVIMSYDSADTAAVPLTWPYYVQRRPFISSAPFSYQFTITDLDRNAASRSYKSVPKTMPTLEELKATPSPIPTPTPSRPPVPVTPGTPGTPDKEPAVDPVQEEWISRGAFAGVIIGCILATFLVTALAAYVILGNKNRAGQADDGYYKL